MFGGFSRGVNFGGAFPDVTVGGFSVSIGDLLQVRG